MKYLTNLIPFSTEIFTIDFSAAKILGFFVKNFLYSVNKYLWIRLYLEMCALIFLDFKKDNALSWNVLDPQNNKAN